jgi:hypothetical protein
MAAVPLYTSPPDIGRNVDENGNVVISPDEWARHRDWLEGLIRFINVNYPNGTSDTVTISGEEVLSA